MISYGTRLLDKAERVELYAARNGELHAITRVAHTALKHMDPNHPLLEVIERVLSDVPNQRPDDPMRRGY